MTYQRSSLSYDSIIEAPQPQQQEDEQACLLPHQDNSHCTGPTTPRGGQAQRRRRHHKKKLATTLAVILSSITTTILFLLLLLWPHMPSEQEREIAQAYDMPLWGSARRIRQAVATTADTSATTLDRSIGVVRDILHNHHHHPALVDPYYNNTLPGCEMTVLLLRHCEKGNIREHCDYMGYERSVYLASSVFGERWPLPALIYAQGPGGRHNRHKMNFRELETIGPLAEKANVSVDDSFHSGNINEMVQEILALRPALCGQAVVVSWKHSDMGHLARHLGCGPLQGCPVDYNGKTFDQVWQIKHIYAQALHSDRKSLQPPEARASWHVFGSVQYENFDPLAFSKQVGDYPVGGTATGGRWRKQALDIPERTDKDWKKVYWQATNANQAAEHDHHHHDRRD